MRPLHNRTFAVLEPDLQISFYYRLEEIKDRYLHEALRRTVLQLNIAAIDRELSDLVRAEYLRRVASFGLRGEQLFAVPLVLRQSPALLAYYRLLLGFSQKEFYNKGPFAALKTLEDSGEVPSSAEPLVIPLCRSLICSAELLVDGLDRLSAGVIRDLQLLTIGPQLRGSENARLGQEASREVRALIRQLVARYVKADTARTLIVQNEAGRLVEIVFSNDPDVRVMEKLPSSIRPVVSMEIKGGTDASNIHNRLGEAEKSHQKARRQGFFEFWTIVRVDIDPEMARRETPTTSHFFNLDRIQDPTCDEHRDFRELLCSRLGIRA